MPPDRSLFLSLPLAGVMREPLWRFLLVVTLAKATRYGVVWSLTLGWR